MEQRCTIPFILLFCVLIFAGDPGPLRITLYNVTPSWRNAQSDIASLKSKLYRTGIGFKDRSGSVVITSIFPESAASKSKLHLRDTILAVNNTPVSNNKECTNAFDATQDAVIDFLVKRGDEKTTITVQRSLDDPLFYKLAYYAEDHYGAIIRYGYASNTEQKIIEQKAFTTSKGFRTEDAHKRLKGHFSEGSLIMLRGGKRILFVLPGWSTVCVNVSDYDGNLLTDSRLKKLWTQIVDKYEDWRYANP